MLDQVEGALEADLHETHVTPDLTVVVATRGEHDVEVFSGGRWRHAIYQVGATGLTPGGEATRLRWRNRKPATPFRTAHLYLPMHFLMEAAELLRRPGQPLVAHRLTDLVSRDGAAFTVITSLLKGMENGAPDIYAETALRWLAMDLLVNFRGAFGPNDDSRRPDLLTDRRLARAIEYMTANLSRPITLADVAREACVSPFHFSRLFRQSTGLTVHMYLTHERLMKAVRLLETTDLPVTAIGTECGYPIPSSFSKAFTRRFGFSPNKVRVRP